MIWTSKSEQWHNHLQLWLRNSCSFPDNIQVLNIFFHTLKEWKAFMCMRLCLFISAQPLAPRAETLYITHYEMRMWTSWWNCTNLHFFLPVWENKQYVSFLSPPPASASTLSSHPSKSSVTGHWPRGALSQNTLFFTPRTKTTLQMTEGLWCHCSHTEIHAPI